MAQNENAACRITAHYRREERYEGLQLVFGEACDLKEHILAVVKEVQDSTGLTPVVYENEDKVNPAKEAIYLEFNDPYDREGSDFFDQVLAKLGITNCC